MCCGPGRLVLLLADHVLDVADLAVVEVEAVVALPSHADDGRLLAPAALHHLPGRLPRLHYDLYLVRAWVVAPDLNLVEVAREEAVLAHAQVLAVAANEEGADNRAHVANHALFVGMRGQSVS